MDGADARFLCRFFLVDQRQKVGFINQIQKIRLILFAVLVQRFVVVNNQIECLAAARFNRDELLVAVFVVKQIARDGIAVLRKAVAVLLRYRRCIRRCSLRGLRGRGRIFAAARCSSIAAVSGVAAAAGITVSIAGIIGRLRGRCLLLAAIAVGGAMLVMLVFAGIRVRAGRRLRFDFFVERIGENDVIRPV